jgi:acyl-CoA thioester hydrolase
MDRYFDLEHRVDESEIDAQQHVHNLRYLQWTLWAAGEHTRVGGWDAKAALELGLGWVVRSHEITYRAAAIAGDELIIRTWVSEVSRFASMRKYAICRPRDQTVLARVETRWVYIDLRQHKVLAIPDELLGQLLVCETPPPLPWS